MKHLQIYSWLTARLKANPEPHHANREASEKAEEIRKEMDSQHQSKA